MKTKVLCILISLFPIIVCAQEPFRVTTEYNFSDSAKIVIITLTNASDEEVVVNNIWLHGIMTEHSHWELQYLDENNQIVGNYFYPFIHTPDVLRPRFIHIEPHHSEAFRYNLYYRIKGNKNACKIKKIAIRYWIEYRKGEGSGLIYNKTEPSVVL